MITKKVFGKTKDGREVTSYRIDDEKNGYVEILDLGGTLQKLCVPNREGNLTDVLLGYDDVAGYEKNGGYLCALIGRFGNRIGEGKLTIDGKTYELYLNDRGNHLHGGKEGFDKKIWSVEPIGEQTLRLSCFSPDGEENYPGNLSVRVDYTFANGELTIAYQAKSDKKTAINLTNHAYFNLSGEGNGDILSHELCMDADRITPTDDKLIPHGEFRYVKGTPFDFLTPKRIGDGDKMRTEDCDLKIGGGFDHCFVLREGREDSAPYATVYSEQSGIEMKCYTNALAVQLYCGNGLNHIGKGGKKYARCYGFCLETQAIPNNVNVPAYAKLGSSVYDKDEEYAYTAKYAFSVR